MAARVEVELAPVGGVGRERHFDLRFKSESVSYRIVGVATPMLDFAVKVALHSSEIDESDYRSLYEHGFTDEDAEAIKQVRPIETMRVFSPTKKNREAFAADMTKKLDIEIIPVDSAENALRGADVVSLTTDSLIPVIKAEWLEPGMHINNVRNNEAGPDVLARADVRARLGTSTLFADRSAAEVVTGSDGMFGFIAGTAEEKTKIPSSPHFEIDNPDIGTVPDIMAGRWAGRTNDQQITFLNNQGTQGLQFAAVGGTAYNLAKAKGLGHPLPLEWFTQNIRD